MNDRDNLVGVSPLVARHLRVGWLSLPVFVGLGLGLELLHAYKIGFYLDVGNEARRLMWTLAHAHGLGLSLLNLLFATSLYVLKREPTPALGLISSLLTGATVLLPLGFFLGGVVIYGGDPGIGVLLVPAGALILLLAVSLMAREVWHALRDRR